jgi:hypothetical protein
LISMRFMCTPFARRSTPRVPTVAAGFRSRRQRFDARETEKKPARVSPWTAAERGWSGDRPFGQRWRVRGSGVCGWLLARCMPEGQGSRSAVVHGQQPRSAGRARCEAGGLPGQRAHGAQWVGGRGEHPLRVTGRGQERLISRYRHDADSACLPPENLLFGFVFCLLCRFGPVAALSLGDSARRLP